MKVQRVPFLRVQTCSFGKAPVREVVLGAQLRVILKQHALRTFASDVDPLVALVHRPKESFFLIPQEELKSVERLQPASRCCKEYKSKETTSLSLLEMALWNVLSLLVIDLLLLLL
ncbi:hypothetical protein ABKV19_027468 [Rosa sericea]